MKHSFDGQVQGFDSHAQKLPNALQGMPIRCHGYSQLLYFWPLGSWQIIKLTVTLKLLLELRNKNKRDGEEQSRQGKTLRRQK